MYNMNASKMKPNRLDCATLVDVSQIKVMHLLLKAIVQWTQ